MNVYRFLFGQHLFSPPSDQSKVIIRPQFDANESLRNLFKLSATTIQFVLWKPVTWIAIFLHYFGFFYMKRSREQCDSPGTCWADNYTAKYSIESTDISVFSILVVFLFVSYTMMCSR
jgi:hypothetical protein